MDERYSIQELLALRRLTRATADLFRAQLRDHLSAMALLLRPYTVFGDYVHGGPKGGPRSEQAFRELQELYEQVARKSPFNLTAELSAPIELSSFVLEMTPLEYPDTLSGGKAVTIVSPLKWVLGYSGFTPARLRELLADPNRSSIEVQRFVIHYLVLHLVFAKQPGIAAVFEAMRFPLSAVSLPGCGELPFACISAPLATARPADSVVAESTELSGMDVFEELVSVREIANLRDPLKDRLLELAHAHKAG